MIARSSETNETIGTNETTDGTAPTDPVPTTIAVAVCTYRRNDALRRLLESVARSAAHLGPRADVGVVVVDDNRDGSASSVVEEFEGTFALGIHYRHVGTGNISEGRNTALDAALELAEWVAMTDDDCVADPDWLAELLDMQGSTDADAVTGPCPLVVPAGSPRWLVDQPFLAQGQFVERNGVEVDLAATHNSMMRSQWLRDHPMVRFDLALGVVGGEDMVFFGRAHAAGMRIRFASRAVVVGHESIERTTYRYRLRTSYWLGNTECVTNLALGVATRPRLLLRGGRRIVVAATRPARRVATREQPQFRFALAETLHGVGLVAGALGVKKNHH